MKDVFRLLSYLKPYWHFQMFYIFSSLGYSVGTLAVPWIEKILIDDVFIARNAGLLLPTCGLWILAAAGMYFFSLGVFTFQQMLPKMVPKIFSWMPIIISAN